MPVHSMIPESSGTWHQVWEHVIAPGVVVHWLRALGSTISTTAWSLVSAAGRLKILYRLLEF